jgi:hypothetical protein
MFVSLESRGKKEDYLLLKNLNKIIFEKNIKTIPKKNRD